MEASSSEDDSEAESAVERGVKVAAVGEVEARMSV
jgi:hypothetical protein